MAYVLPVTDEPRRDDADRYAVYVVNKRGRFRLAETDQDGLGIAIVTLADEGDITSLDSLGILDRRSRRWVVNPWAGPHG